MAGHSQFKNIMYRKGAQDIKKAKVFTKIGREIMAACKTGTPDPSVNPRLRSAIQWAREENMPRDKIEASIKRATGNADADHFEPVRYEGYGPGGVAVIVQALTDNRNRTASDVRSIFTKNSGNMGESGSVSFMFSYVGAVTYPVAVAGEEAMLEAAIDAGAENCELDGDTHLITTSVEEFGHVRDALEAKFGAPKSAKLTWVAGTTASPNEEQAKALMKLIETLDDHDDVQEVFTNAEFSSEMLEKLAG